MYIALILAWLSIEANAVALPGGCPSKELWHTPHCHLTLATVSVVAYCLSAADELMLTDCFNDIINGFYRDSGTVSGGYSLGEAASLLGANYFSRSVKLLVTRFTCFPPVPQMENGYIVYE
jgi:hypothetical protein